MKLLANRFKSLQQDERGSNAVEYIAIAALIAIFCFIAFQTFGGAVTTAVTNNATQVQGL